MEEPRAFLFPSLPPSPCHSRFVFPCFDTGMGTPSTHPFPPSAHPSFFQPRSALLFGPIMASDILIHLFILLLSVAGACYALWPSSKATVVLFGTVEVAPFAISQPHLVIQQGHSRKEVRLGPTGSFRVRMVCGGSIRIRLVEGQCTKQTYHVSHHPEQLALSSKAVPVFDLGLIGTSENLNNDRICQVLCATGGTLVVRAGHVLDQRVPRDRRLLDHSAQMLSRPNLHCNGSLTIASKTIT